MPRRCPKKNATTLPISSARAGVMVNGARLRMLLGTANSTPTMTAMSICCQRRGGRVSGSLSMNPARKTAGPARIVKFST